MKRKRWHSDGKLDRLKDELRKKMKANMTGLNEDLPSKRIRQATSIHVVRECDLRATLEEKALSTHDFAAWTAFVNRAGTLVHVVPKEGDFHIRIPLYFSVRHMSDVAVERLLQGIALGRLR